MSLKYKITTLIEEKDLTLNDLCLKSGLTQSTLKNVIYGRVNNPTINVLNALAKALDCSVIDLINDEYSSVFNDNWNPITFYHCLEIVGKELSKKNKDLSYTITMNIIKDLYLYSVEENNGKVSKEMLYILIKNTI